MLTPKAKSHVSKWDWPTITSSGKSLNVNGLFASFTDDRPVRIDMPRLESAPLSAQSQQGAAIRSYAQNEIKTQHSLEPLRGRQG
jgi:hypothetical protein